MKRFQIDAEKFKARSYKACFLILSGRSFGIILLIKGCKVLKIDLVPD